MSECEGGDLCDGDCEGHGYFKNGAWYDNDDKVWDRDLRPIHIGSDTSEDLKFIRKFNDIPMPETHPEKDIHNCSCGCNDNSLSTYFGIAVGFSVGAIIGYLIGVVT